MNMKRPYMVSLLLAVLWLLAGCAQSEPVTLPGDWRLEQVTEQLDGTRNSGLKHPIRAFTHWHIGEERIMLSDDGRTEDGESMEVVYTLVSDSSIRIDDLVFSFTLDQQQLILEQEGVKMVFQRMED